MDQVLVFVNSIGTDDKLLLLETSISGNCYIVFISTIVFGPLQQYSQAKSSQHQGKSGTDSDVQVGVCSSRA